MTAVVWTAFGMTFGCMLLHVTLALRRPPDPMYLSFACVMASVTAFLYVETTFYTASTLHEAVEAVRRRDVIAHALIASLLVFLPAYTGARIGRIASLFFWTALAVMFVANLVLPYGIWFSSEPQLVRATFAGASYTTLVAPPFGLLQHAYGMYQASLFVLAVVLAVQQMRRGQRQRGIVLIVAACVVLAHAALDTVREAVGGTWPNAAELGFVLWGLIMSVQLALDFRAQTFRLANAIAQSDAKARHLTAILGAMAALERDIYLPLGKLESGLDALAGATTEDGDLDRMRRAVLRLRELAAER